MGLDAVEIIIKIEKHFNISMSDERCSNMVTVSDLVNYTFELQKSSLNFNISQVQIKVIEIIHKTQGIPFTEITLGAKLVEDLGID